MTIRYMFRIELPKFQILIHFTDYIAHGFDSYVFRNYIHVMENIFQRSSNAKTRHEGKTNDSFRLTKSLFKVYLFIFKVQNE